MPLPRPREPRSSCPSEFLALRRGLMSLIREESLKAMGGEINDDAMKGLAANSKAKTSRARSDAAVRAPLPKESPDDLRRHRELHKCVNTTDCVEVLPGRLLLHGARPCW